MNIVSIIPARGGSKGVPNKNKRLFLGHPLVAHSIMYSQSSNKISKTFVSTDDLEIMQISKKYGAEVIERPANISGDKSTTESAIEHAISSMEEKPDVIVLLQPTSPIRPKNSLDKALDSFITQKKDSLLSLSPTHNFFWQLSDNIAKPHYDFMNRPMRQQMKQEDIRYIENGSLYIFNTNHFLKHSNRLGGDIGYIIFDEDYSKEIDTEFDFIFLELLGKNLG